ncbi:MAG: hypothetical protein GDA36_08770 [Rhodobacteraceae bacterium]|nr:hypothetical protein [Paracoccaceae bacterium]
MKSAFALYLSLDVVELLCRSGDGWWRVGRADPCGSDLAGEMTALRTMAKIAVPGPATAKLILPNDQIRYLTVDTETDDAVMRTALVEAALGQATPYALADLVYDICPDGIQTHVAAVARETLAEAEAFAVEHGFAPLSFVAIPGDMPFMGEPFFGTSTHAVDVVPPGDVVEADGIAVVVTGDYMPPSVSFSNRRRQATVTPDPAPERGVPDPGPLIDAGPEFDMRILDGDVDIEPGTVPRGIEPMVPSPPLQISVADPAPFDTPPMRTRFLSCQKTDALPSAVILPDPDAPDVQPIATTAGDTADDRLLMTVFGARGNKPARGTPGLPGLVLATLLLIFLAVAALWVLLFLEVGTRRDRSDLRARVASLRLARSDGWPGHTGNRGTARGTGHRGKGGLAAAGAGIDRHGHSDAGRTARTRSDPGAGRVRRSGKTGPDCGRGGDALYCAAVVAGNRVAGRFPYHLDQPDYADPGCRHLGPGGQLCHGSPLARSCYTACLRHGP